MLNIAEPVLAALFAILLAALPCRKPGRRSGLVTIRQIASSTFETRAKARE